MSLDIGDGIVDPLTSFLIQEDLGAGDWIWSGTWNTQTFTNTSEPGQYYLATDGNVYFVPAFGPVATITSAEVQTAPTFTFNDGVVGGGSGDDVIDTGYTDSDGDQVGSGADVVRAGGGDDSVQSGGGADTITGGAGSDTIDAGAGDDVIYGDTGTATAASESLNWGGLDANGGDLSAGFTLSTGEMDVTVSFADDGNNAPTFTTDSSRTNFVDTGEPFNPTSSLYLFANGDGASSTTSIDFAAGSGSTMSDEVENVTFRLSDVDWGSGNHRDVVTVNAFDANGNAVAVTLTAGGIQTVLGTTVTAGNDGTLSQDEEGSVLVEIAGPVQTIEIVYANAQSGTHGLHVTDIHFDTILPAGGDDSILGGAGNDQIFGEAGNDTMEGGTGGDLFFGGLGDDEMYLAQGDTAFGGEGDDLFVLGDLGEPGSGTITITGGEGGETNGDTLQLTPDVGLADITFTNTDDAAGGLSGTFSLADGTTVSFSEIENIICFTPGARIMTEHGERAIETLRAGDRVLTRDNGLQPIRWIGHSTVEGRGRFAPIAVNSTVIDGARRPLLVSPQHRLLFTGYKAQLLFGRSEVLVAAKHLIDGKDVRIVERACVTYFHLMLDHHEVIYAEGAATESFHAGDMSVSALAPPAREALFQAFPHLRANVWSYGDTVRQCLKRHEAHLLKRPPIRSSVDA